MPHFLLYMSANNEGTSTRVQLNMMENV